MLALLIFAVGAVILLAWSIRPSQTIADASRYVYAPIAIGLWIVAAGCWVLYRVQRTQQAPRFARGAPFLLTLDVLIGIAVLAGPALSVSVSEVIIDNQTNQELHDVTIEARGATLQWSTISAGERIQLPIMPHSEGPITFQARLGPTQELSAEGVVLSRRPTNSPSE